MKIVAVTACPTGIAHTYMAAEQLEKTARKLGHAIKVETQGAMGIENELEPGGRRRTPTSALFAARHRGRDARSASNGSARSRRRGAGGDQDPEAILNKAVLGSGGSGRSRLPRGRAGRRATELDLRAI